MLLLLLLLLVVDFLLLLDWFFDDFGSIDVCVLEGKFLNLMM